MTPTQNASAVRYVLPTSFVNYDPQAIAADLVEAKAAVLSLKTIPYQRSWVEELEKMELKREVAGTSRIEGAQFSEKELEVALQETPEQALNRSQREARAALHAYRWIALLPNDRSVDMALVCDIHRRIVKDADDDRCEPGTPRRRDENVLFGAPTHRGADGGEECHLALERLCRAIQTDFRAHDDLVQALAAHYHLAAMHPFGDGNGRTARALEALLLRRAGLRDVCFIPMSNYYYDEKPQYLAALNAVRAANHDLTPFLKFALKGIASQSRRLLDEIRRNVAKGLFRNLMFDLFQTLKTARTRVIATRQLEILKVLLDRESLGLEELAKATAKHYSGLKTPRKTFIRDINSLIKLKTIDAAKNPDETYRISIRLQWPMEITQSDFFALLKSMPKAKTHSFLR